MISPSSHLNTMLNKLDKHSYSLLHYAVRYNHLQIVKHLLSCNADPNIKGGEEQSTPLHIAAMYKSSDDSGSSVCQVTDPSNLDVAEIFDETANHLKLLKRQQPHSAAKEIIYDSHGILIPEYKGSRFLKSRDKDTQALPHTDTIINALILKSANINARDKSDATPLCYAAMKRNGAALSELLEYPTVDIEAKDASWMTPLHYAAEQGCPRIARILIEHKADIKALNKFDMTPLHLACEEGHPEVARLILSAYEERWPQHLKEYVNKKDRNRLSPLHYAATSGVVELVSLLLEYGAECTFDSLNDYTSPLHLACITGKIENVTLLVENNSKIVDVKNQDQETPLMIAASLNRIDILTYLLKHDVDIDGFDQDQETALFLASKKDHIDSVKILLDAGAKLEKRNKNDHNPLHIAASNNSLRVAEYLLSTSYKDSLQNSWDRYENRPIHLAVMNNHFEMVKMLIEGSSPVDEKNANGLTPLLIAASRGYIDILKYLIDISLPLAVDEDDKNNTALHLAAENGFHRVIPILVDCGVNVDYRNNQQMTALDLACSRGHYKAALALIESEATIDTAENSKHLPPLIIASKYGHAELISLLLSRGADITKMDSTGRNCLEIAIDENRKEAVLAILNSVKWENALRHIAGGSGSVMSPLRRMIDTMPEMAEVVLDKCISNNQLPKNHPKYQIICNYEYLEDMHTVWGRELKNMPIRIENKSTSICSSIINKFSNFVKVSQFKRNNRNHPLSMMIEKGRYAMLGHPLIRYLVRNKWKSSSFYIYYIKIFILMINIIFLTGLCLATASPPYKCIKADEEYVVERLNYSYIDDIEGCQYCPFIPPESTAISYIFVYFGKFIVLILSFLLLMQKTLEVYSNIYNLFSAQSMFEIFGVVLAITYASGLLSFGSKPFEIFYLYRCTNKFRSVGAVALCFSWLSFVLYLTKLPKIGIYIVMYTDIFKTFLQFVPVYFMLILSFSLPFYMLFLDRHETNSYVTPFKSIMKTFVATVGEIEYDTFYNTKDEPPLPITYLILFIFLLVNSIILMNLLVGLAVDDIQGVQSKAFFKRLALRIKMSMEFESMLMGRWDRRIVLNEAIFPNQTKGHSFWSFWEFKSNPFTEDKTNSHDQFELMRLSMKEMKDSFRYLKHQIKIINDKNNRLESLLEELLRRMNDNSQL
ncbi:Transient receptor potential cation channel subfamily A member 1 [Thelohanellus kitauei]|uniref:Transient receptor potential cation channel subfamily A member 1 n=1 Tax=Thelohanellus kitauei TaxID=669202 RepID=A0A0C2JMV4_THEKT|nr:Transient receptor potential cation channel subfamily A member 1 [Thelohanellus kitauei]